MRQQTGKNQSWRKNWEKKWKTGWIKHAAAVGLAASMAVTTPLSVLAENTTNIEQNETVTAAFTADSTAAAETNNQSEISNQEETNHQKEINNQGEVNNQDSTAAEEPSKEEVQLSLQLVAVEADTTKPSLKLDAAVKLSGKLKVNTSDDGTKTIEVTDGEGLIMLSNVEPKDYKNCTIKLVTTSGWNLTTPVTPTKANETSGTTGTDGTGEVAGTQYHFLGLGDTANPYEGKFMFDKDTSANNYSISTTRSLFNALSTTATLENMIPFSIDKENYTSTEPLLAAALKAGISDSAGDQSTKTTLKCNIALRNIDAEDISSETTIGGLIGTMEANTSADITFTNQFSKELNVSGTSHVGLFCNTMESGASLTATYTKDSGAGKISVKTTSSNNDAGGFVGHMEKNTSLTIAGTSVDKVSAASGNAGGIVGSATDGTISLKTETTAEGTNDPTTFTFADVLLSAGSEKAVGGLIGAYSVTSERNGTPINFDLSQYRFKSITVTGGKDVGGLFGALKNTSTISATVTVSGKTTSAITTNVTNETGVTNLGGLIGTYDTVESTDPNSEKVMKNTLAIKGDSNTAGSFIAAATTGGSKANTTYGGVIGAVSGSSYVEIENVSASIADMKNSNNTSVGGLVGKMNDGFLNVGSVKLATTGDNDLGKAAEKKAAGADNVEGHGGLVGHLVKGVLRLHGKTNLSEQKITTAYNHVGQIVGFNENGLIYALGNGNNLDSYGSGWSLTRYSGADRGGSDIGNWGAVVRLGDMLMEGNDGALTFDDQAHTVTVNNGTDENVNNTNAFAAYALAFVFANTDTGKTEALKVKKDVKRDDKQTVTLTGDVDLTGTGIIGIGKDNIEKDKSAQKFTGTLDGGGNTITLDIGTPYGNDISARNNNAAGQLYAKRSDQRDTHYSLALIPFAGDVTISNLTIAGNVNCKIPKTVNQEEKEIKYPAFVASAIGCASGTTEFNSVIVNTKVSVEEESDAKKLLTWQGGFLARCEGNTLSFTNCKWEDSASLDDERDTDNHRIGGLAAEVMGGCTVTVNNCTLSGSITSKSTANANVGGLIAVSRGEDSNNNSKPNTINISNLQVNGEKVTTSAATTSGGLLGYQWKNTNVVFATAGSTGNADAGTIAVQSGVTISDSTLNANTAQFGGLVYQATGYWNATAKDSIVFTAASENTSDAQGTDTKNTFTGKSDQDTPSGLLVGTGLITETKETNTITTALYLEVGTWGNVSDAAYKINAGAVTLGISGLEYFDELVGITISDNAGNNNAVVSLAVRDSNGKAVCIDKGTNTNTYTGQLDSANYKNGKTRYYYNLDSYRKDKYTTDLKIINTVEDLVLWSAAQYAAENIRTCFRKEITSTPENPFITSISGDLNLYGYSYYPVTPLTIVHIGSEYENDIKNKTTLTFAYDTMNTIEGTNKKFSDSDHQHYLMQHGLLYNTSHGILVNQTAFAGVVGKKLIKKADGTENTTQYNSGALIYGSVIGNPISNIVGITLKNVTLDGIRVTGVEKGREDTYAPLLINKIAKAATLIVNNLSTSGKYTEGEGTSKTTMYAATSLIGSVGSDQASKLTLSFSNIALDGRVSADTAKSTSVQNNGKTNDITISAETFGGLGTLTNPFSGVIIGGNTSDANQPITVHITKTNANKDSFGGLIAYSRGSVVKDLTVDYSQADIQMNAEKCPGTEKNPFFGGVVGYCMGGDTIIDHVSVNYSASTVSFDGTYKELIAAGGYVGLVGGATNVTEKSDYEKTGGGVVFRDMTGTTNTFTTVCAEAAAENKTVNMEDVDANNKAGKSTTDGGSYFYRNPYVGRVLDGYACAENCTVDNTDKNYTIPNLQAGTTDLTVSENSGALDVTVTSAQGLWLLSAIVNSGAGAMDSNGSYTDVDNNVVDAYQYGKPRTASYEGIGAAEGTDATTLLADEKYWGGNASTARSDDAKARVSYLVKNYTTDTTAARLAGKSSDANTTTNFPVNLTFSADSIDMRDYGNGFRGIGCSYGENKEVWNTDCSIPKVYRRSLQIKSINDKKTSATTITLNMNQSSYDSERTNGSWCSQGAGLFVDFHFTDNCTVNNLIISGKVKLGLFNDNSLTYMSKVSGHAVGVGGFAARTANSTGTVTFNNFSLYTMNVYGGTMTGGAIGYIDGYNKAQRNVTFNNWSIKNANVSKWVDNDGSAGGLVGWNIGYGTLEIKRDSNEDVNISNLKVTTISSVCNVAAAGGLVGACDYSGVSISNVNAEYLTVTGKLVRDIGGLIAGERNKNHKNVSVKNCVLHNVNVDNNITNKTESRTGGIIGYHDGQLTIKSVTLDKDSTINGQQYTGGFVGESNAYVSIANCSEKNVSVKSNTKNWVGGFIGHLGIGKNATFTNCQQENVTVLGRYVGGLVGAADGDMQASNIEFQNVIVATNKGEKDSRNTGLLTGSTNILNKNISVKGYNILAQSCEVGYANGASNLLTADIKPMDTAGFWIGESGPKDTINLTAVSAFGTVFPQKDIGKQSGSATMATIIYADAAADKIYNPIDTAAKPSPSANPWLDVNPKSDVPFADGTVMTGNAVGVGKTETGTASAILTELGKTSHASAYYWNVDDDTKKDVAKLLVSTNDAYLTTYRAEESATTTVSEKVDFPVLVVNNSAEVDTLLWNFIAAMTNVKNGETAKEQVKDITATTYKWNSTSDTDDTNSTFIAQDKASLTVSSSKKISITPNAYDNQSSQFTLLDVTYEDPTDSTHAFHLYIPVLVKKVLYINFKTRFIAGTDYCASDYPMTDTSPNHYATAGFNEPVTAYMEYRYEKETDWQYMLDNGENLLWYYDKILDLASGSTSAVGTTLLPAGTRLTLVDRQTMQYYTYTTTGTEDFHKFKLTDMTAPGTDSAGKTSPFAPVFICDLLELKAEEVSNQTDGATYYVQETDPSKATVRVGADYYRKATDDDVKDSNVTKYKITVPSENGVKERTESYYLTIQIPDTKDLSIVNNRLYAATMSRKEGTLPAVIKSDKTTDSSAYVVYNGVQQSLTISTSRIHNGSDTGDTAMENGDGIKISLTSKLWLTEAGKSQFKSLGPSEVYHEFDVSLKKYLKEAAGISDVIGTENITYTYTVAKSDNKTIFTEEGSLSGIAGKDTLTLQYGSVELKRALELAEAENSAVTVTAVITLTYDGADKFPVKDTAVTFDNSGTSVVGVSRIANTLTQLPITENKKTDENQNRYYVTNPSKAKLTYSSVNVDPNVTSDTTQQLGVNPWDTVNNRSDMIYTRADYDYSNVDAAVLNNANKIRYKMELFQKNEIGSYDETKPLSIKDYLQNTVKENGSTEASPAGSSETSGTGTVYQWEESFKSDDGRHQIARFRYAPFTGEAFERKNYTYANYRVRLTVVLLDDKGNELDGTKATDYIIYTNARISQEIMQQQQ